MAAEAWNALFVIARERDAGIIAKRYGLTA